MVIQVSCAGDFSRWIHCIVLPSFDFILFSYTLCCDMSGYFIVVSFAILDDQYEKVIEKAQTTVSNVAVNLYF